MYLIFYISILFSLTYCEEAEKALPEPDTQICRSDEESATFFYEKGKVLESDVYGFIPPMKSSCKTCTTGTQYNYLAINAGVDVKLSELDIMPGNPVNTIIGMFGCDNSTELCIEAVNGELYTAFSEYVVFYTTPYCEGGYCDTIILLTETSSIKRLSDGEIYSYLDQTTSLNPLKYKDSSEHNYLRIRGFSCNACKSSIPYCDKVDGRVKSKTEKSSTGTVQSDSPNIQSDFPRPYGYGDIEDSGYSGDNSNGNMVKLLDDSKTTAVEDEPSTIDNYGMKPSA